MPDRPPQREDRPGACQARIVARRHRISEEEAARLIAQHEDDEDKLAEAARSIRHFLRAPS